MKGQQENLSVPDALVLFALHVDIQNGLMLTCYIVCFSGHVFSGQAMMFYIRYQNYL